MREYLLLILCILTTGLAGLSVLCIAAGRKNLEGISFLEGISLSYIFGLSAISIQMFAMGLMGLELTPYSVLIMWAPVVIITTIFILPKPAILPALPEPFNRRLQSAPNML